MPETYTPDKLIGGDFPLVTKPIVVISGAGALVRGGVLGKITVGAVPTTGTGAGTGDGTCTVVTGGVDVKVGTYTATCTVAVTNGGTFVVTDPDGNFVTSGIIVAGAGGTIALVSTQINMLITDGSTDFVVGDVFTIVVPAGSLKYQLVDSTAIDGSAVADGVLTEAAAAAAADVTTSMYQCGQFNDVGLTFGGTDTIATHRDAMRKLSMFTRASQAVPA